MKTILLRLIPHFVAIIIFVIAACVYFGPVWNGYDLRQGDINNWRGMSKEIADYRLMNNDEPLWTNSMFGGMPAYQVSTLHPSNLLRYADGILRLGIPGAPGTLFLCMIGFYIFCLCMRINPWVGIAGAIGFGFASINLLYLGAGHTGKVHAIAYLAPALGAFIFTYREKKIFGAALFALFLGLNIYANHVQITYYLAFLLGAVALGELARTILAKQLTGWISSSLLLLVAAGIAVLPSAGNLLSTYEYSKFTTRGKTELTIDANGEKKSDSEVSGLEESYMLDYNFGSGEAWSLIIPNAKGGKSDYIRNNKELMQKIPRNFRENIGQTNQYWGEQHSTGGAFYFGAVIMFLFVLGLIFTKDILRWPFLFITVLALGLCLKEMTALNDFFIHKVPLYNKFRDSKMILVLIQVIAPAMAVLFINQLIARKLWVTEKKWLFAGLASLTLILIIVASSPKITGPLFSGEETEYFAQTEDKFGSNPEQMNMLEDYKNALAGVREDIFKADAQRTIVFVFITIALVLITWYRLIPHWSTGLILIAMVAGDMIPVDQRYLNSSKEKNTYRHYVPLDEKLIPNEPSKADYFILEAEKKQIENFSAKSDALLAKMKSSGNFDKVKKKDRLEFAADFGALYLNSDYRVLTLGNPFNDASTSYFHKSIGGYHGAKLKRYQELIEFYLSDEIHRLIDSLKTNQSLNVLATLPAINMLNTKYIVFNPDAPPIQNPYALGNAWFVEKINLVNSANEEMKAIASIDPAKTAIIDQRFASVVNSPTAKDSTSHIVLAEYKTNYLKYTSSSKVDAPAIFSEIYYPEGWICKIDGQEKPYFRADYVLRGVMVPSGDHTIEWSFEPEVYKKGEIYSLAGSLLLLLLVGGMLVKEIKNSFSPAVSKAS
ncbi:MAG: hypothetical protein IT223_00760 [Crocinitomicaceae bacterium]|nr:hypothetical protein [Crocinitomicaceae bacterium]